MRGQRTLLYFVVLIIAGAAVTVFVIRKAENAIAEIDALANSPEYAGVREFAGGAIDTSGWQTYRNEQYGFEVKYPPGWSQWYADSGAGPWFFASTAESEKIQGLGIPQPNAEWLAIAKDVCENPTSDFAPVEYVPGGTDTLEKTVCAHGFQLTVGLWDSDPDKAANKNMLQLIVNSFRKM